MQGKLNTRKIIDEYMLELILLGLIIIMSFLSSKFLMPGNLLNILRNISMQGVLALGMTIVMIGGELDLSVASSIALVGVIIGYIGGKCQDAGMSLTAGCLIGMVAAVCVCIIVGLINGWLRMRFTIPSMIITLAMQYILYGIAALISKGFPIITFPQWYSVFGSGYIGIVPIPAIIFIVVALITYLILSHMKYGRNVYAVGGNPEAARLSGINVKKTKIISMVIVQICCFISGVMLSSQVMSGTFTFAKGWDMTAISAVIIGGVALSGGKGKIRGTVVGIIFLGVILNGMTLLGVNDYAQYIVRGGLIVLAVILNALKDSLGRK